jgi:hypothetical protein
LGFPDGNLVRNDACCPFINQSDEADANDEVPLWNVSLSTDDWHYDPV